MTPTQIEPLSEWKGHQVPARWWPSLEEAAGKASLWAFRPAWGQGTAGHHVQPSNGPGRRLSLRLQLIGALENLFGSKPLPDPQRAGRGGEKPPTGAGFSARAERPRTVHGKTPNCHSDPTPFSRRVLPPSSSACCDEL